MRPSQVWPRHIKPFLGTWSGPQHPPRGQVYTEVGDLSCGPWGARLPQYLAPYVSAGVNGTIRRPRFRSGSKSPLPRTALPGAPTQEGELNSPTRVDTIGTAELDHAVPSDLVPGRYPPLGSFWLGWWGAIATSEVPTAWAI